jgi:hypothetical protein
VQRPVRRGKRLFFRRRAGGLKREADTGVVEETALLWNICSV